jgi:hypothetical protein
MCPLIGIEELLRAAIALREFPRNCQSKSSQLETKAARPRTKKLSLHARRQTRPVVGDVDHSPLGDIAHVHAKHAKSALLLRNADRVMKEIEDNPK